MENILRLTWDNARYKEGDLTDKEFETLRKASFRNKGRLALVKFLRNGYVSVMGAKYRRNKQLLIDEILRVYNTGQYYCHPFCYSAMSGQFCCMDDTDLDHAYISGWGCRRFTDTYADVTDRLFYTEWKPADLSFAEEGYTDKELMAWLRRYCPYLKPKDEERFAWCVNNPAWVVKRYNEGLPASELLVKAGYYSLAFNKGITKLKSKAKKSALFRLLKEHPELYDKYSPTAIFQMATQKLTPEQYKRKQAITKFKRALNYVDEELGEQAKEVFCFLEKLKFDPKDIYVSGWGSPIASGSDYGTQLFFEYIREMKRSNFKISNYNVWHPKWLSEAIKGGDVYETLRSHTEKQMKRRYEKEEAERKARLAHEEAERAKKKASMEQRLSLFAKTIGDMEKDGWCVHVLASTEEFIKTGNLLCNCVGTHNYNEKMANHKTFCFTIAKVGEDPLLCAEAEVKTRKVLQLYGEHNRVPDIPEMPYLQQLASDYVMSRSFKNARKTA